MIVILDGYNLMHRARSGFQLGNFNVVFNFLRGLKPLIEKFKPTRVYFTLEGEPKRQKAKLPSYKANRIIDRSTEKGEEKYKTMEDFHRQKDIIIDLLKKHFPLSVIRHPDFEGDDLIYNIIKNASSAIDFVVVSTDSDFTQLLQEFSNVKLYHPIDKAFVEAPDHHYVTWKALRGDGSDNIPGIVNEGEALALVNDPVALERFFLSKENSQLFERNCDLIQFAGWTLDEMKLMESSTPVRDWDAVKAQLEAWEFKSMLKESYWDKFVAAFEPLWG